MSKWIDGKWLLNFFVEFPDDYTLTIGNLRAVINDAPTIEVSEDCISRAKALEIYSDLYWMDERLLNFKDELDKVYEKLRNAPSVVPKPKEGEWIYIDEPIIGNPYGRYRCSECELEEPHETDFCPNCGCDMLAMQYPKIRKIMDECDAFDLQLTERSE